MQYVRRLDRRLVVEATHQTHATWGEGKPLATYTEGVLEQLRRAGPELLRYVGLVDRGRLYASIKRYGLALRGPAGLVPALGIGAVFTRPSARGRGLAAELLDAVLEEARGLGYGAAFLYSDIAPDYYERLGFVSLAHGARDFVVETAALPEKGAFEVRPARSRDVGLALEAYEQAFAREHPRWLRPARSRALFDFFTWRNGVRAFVLHEGGADRGVLLAGRDDPSRDLPHPREPGLLFFDEAWTLSSVDPARVWATARALATRLRAKRVRGWAGANGVPAGARVEARTGAFPMMAALTPSLTVGAKSAYVDSFQHF